MPAMRVHLRSPLWIVGALLTQSVVVCDAELPSEVMRRIHLAERVKGMFTHGWDAYLTYGFPSDELTPLTCSGRDTWGSYVSDGQAAA